MTVAALLLAAGNSQRFGPDDKLLAHYQGRPLITYAAAAVTALAVDSRIAVISNPDLAAHLAGFEIVQLRSGDDGLSASLKAGLARARLTHPDCALVALADMPHVSTELMAQVIAASTANTPAAANNGRRAMPPACFPACYFDQLAALQGDKGAREILDTLPPEAHVLASLDQLHDVDRPEDLS